MISGLRRPRSTSPLADPALHLKICDLTRCLNKVRRSGVLALMSLRRCTRPQVRDRQVTNCTCRFYTTSRNRACRFVAHEVGDCKNKLTQFHSAKVIVSANHFHSLYSPSEIGCGSPLGIVVSMGVEVQTCAGAKLDMMIWDERGPSSELYNVVNGASLIMISQDSTGSQSDRAEGAAFITDWYFSHYIIRYWPPPERWRLNTVSGLPCSNAIGVPCSNAIGGFRLQYDLSIRVAFFVHSSPYGVPA